MWIVPVSNKSYQKEVVPICLLILGPRGAVFTVKTTKKLLALHLKSNSLFEDPYFPPTSSSLSSSGKVEGDWARGEASPTSASDIKWVRASNLFPNAQLVIEGVSKDDVNQGRY